MKAVSEGGPGSADEALVERILGIVRERTGTDFALYRPPTMRRRIGNRMISVGIAELADYLDYLQTNEDEARALVGRLTIKVSRFYRNAATFDHLRACVIPGLAQSGAPLRVWSAGCGRGEEAYTLAMLLTDAGVEGTVHATDIDAEALEQAAAATYGPDALGELPGDLAARYLEAVPHAAGPRYRVCAPVRRRIMFSRCDITRDAAPAGDASYDLIAFRNVAIYLKREVHDPIFARLLAALRPGGCLCLGEAEWPPAAAELRLQCAARRLRVFRSHCDMAEAA
jgi:chemotaxis methyl-accepting protein methylase